MLKPTTIIRAKRIYRFPHCETSSSRGRRLVQVVMVGGLCLAGVVVASLAYRVWVISTDKDLAVVGDTEFLGCAVFVDGDKVGQMRPVSDGQHAIFIGFVGGSRKAGRTVEVRRGSTTVHREHIAPWNLYNMVSLMPIDTGSRGKGEPKR